MNQGKRYAVVILSIGVFGFVRLPVEHQFTSELREAQLLPIKLQVETGAKIGQTFSAVALGGLRTLVATFMNLRAFAFFTEQKWAEVEETFDTIVDLAPRTRYYWETSSWHQSYNAASYYLYDSKLPPLRRKLAWKESVLKGKAILERGIQNNPGDARLYERLGALLMDRNKVEAFETSASAYEESFMAYSKSVELGSGRKFARRAAVYALARVPGREAESLRLIQGITKDLYRAPPTIRALNFTLSYQQNPEQDIAELIAEIFTSSKSAYDILSIYWLRGEERFPLHGIAKTLARLELELKVPKAKSVFQQQIHLPGAAN